MPKSERRRQLLAAVLAVLALSIAGVSACGSSLISGVGFPGGVQVVLPAATSLNGEPTTLTLCIRDHCVPFAIADDKRNPKDLYPFPFTPDETLNQDLNVIAVGRVLPVRVLLTGSGGNKIAEATVKAPVRLVKPGRCYGDGPVLAVTLLAPDQLRAIDPAIPNLPCP